MINKQGTFADLHSFKVSAGKQDITEAVATLLIFQDLFSPVWSAHIEVIDTSGIYNKAGIAPGTPIGIELQTQQGFDTDGKESLVLYVHEVSDRTLQGQNTVTYLIKAAGKDLIQNSKKRVAKSFKQKRIDEIVKSIVSDFLSGSVGDTPPKPEQHEPHLPYKRTDGKRQPSRTDQEINWIAPNVNPYTAIGQLMAAAQYNGETDFVFFTKKGTQYSFESLSNMLKRKPCAKFVQRPNAIRQDGDSTRNKNLEFSYYVIDHFSEVPTLSAGHRGSTSATFDTKTKRWSTKTTGEEFDAVVAFTPKAPSAFFHGEGLLDKSAEWFSERRQGLFNAEKNLLKIQTPGHAKAFGWLGEMVEIDVPSHDSMGSPEQLDQKYKGEYLVVSIGHYITKESYYVNIELADGWTK